MSINKMALLLRLLRKQRVLPSSLFSSSTSHHQGNASEATPAPPPLLVTRDSVDERVVVMTLNRPSRGNSLNIPLLLALRDHINSLNSAEANTKRRGERGERRPILFIPKSFSKCLFFRFRSWSG